MYWMFSLFIMVLVQQTTAFAQNLLTSEEWQFLVFQTQDGDFNYCVTQNNYDNDRYTLLFARRQAGDLAIVLRITNAQLRLGQSIPLTLRIDNNVARKVIGVPTTQEIMNIDLGGDEELYRNFMTGLVLSIEPQNQEGFDSLSFALTGTKYALTRLKACSDNQGTGFPKANVTERTQPQLPPVPRFIAQVIGTLGMHTYPLSLSNNAVGWGFGPVLGFIEGIPVQAEQQTNEIVLNHINLVQQRCEGDFTEDLSQVQAIRQIELQRGSAMCTTSEAFSVYRMGLPTLS